MFIHPLDDRSHLAMLDVRQAADWFALVEGNRAHLAPWMGWVERVRSLADAEAYLRRDMGRWAEGTGLYAGIWHDGRLAGAVDIHGLNARQGTGEVGYWLGVDAEGKGLITRACRPLIDHAFGTLGLRRLEIRCLADNRRSRAVAERLGFIMEGVLREAWHIDGRVSDDVVYGLLAREWARDR